jgi:type VI protein secretion system component Hcp
MAIESDVYVKLGDDPGARDDYGEPYPLIEGDCTDDTHYWWCELRSCGFNLTVPDHSKLEGDSGASDSGTNSATKTKPKTKWEKVSMKKRIDWASTHLFLRCCEAGRRKIDKAKADEDHQDPTINTVTVHVCKTAAGQKFPFVVIWYNGVRVTDYKVDMSGPEPEETIEIEFDSYEFGYQPTDPVTGKPVGSMVKTGLIERDEDPTHDSEEGTVPGGSSTAAAAVAAATGVAAGGAPATAAAAAGGGTPGITTATEAAVGANFPGLWQGNGFGLLPD